MARKKKSRRLTDIMPMRKSDKKPEQLTSRPGRKPTRYELDVQAREQKKKRKHKGKPSGSRHNVAEEVSVQPSLVKKDPRIGSRKKVPLMVEFVNRPDKPESIKSVENTPPTHLDPMLELERLENNEILNQFLDQIEAGKSLKADEQQFVDECLTRIAELMEQLGLSDESENEEDLYRTFERIDINQFR